MKNYLIHGALFFALIFCAITKTRGQNITVISNPNAPSLFSWTGSGALSGYSGAPIILKNSLVIEYNASGTSDPTQITQQLAVYSGGTNFTTIANPDNGQGVYFQSVQLVHNDSLFFIYIDASGKQRLASFDGSAITLYPNPDAGLGYIGSPRILNNTLYVAYSNVSGVTQFGKFNGSGISLIPNPDGSALGFYNDYSVVFDNKICSRYIMADNTKHLATFDGNSWTVYPNPDNTTRGVIPEFPGVYHNKLYFFYYSAGNQYQLMEYDGTNNPTLISNPENSSLNNGGVSGFPIVLNDTLFFQYDDISNVERLAKFDGTTISLVPNPDASPYGFYNTPIIYNNNLYIFYVTPDAKHHLAEYISSSNSLNLYSNPDGGSGYWDQPIIYGNKLFFQYYNASSNFQLGYFSGNSIKLIANPTGIFNGASGNNGYMGQPILWNNILYMQMGSIPYGNAGNLAFFDGGTLPITLLNFNAQIDNHTSLLQWSTTNELNNAYFSVERSIDGSTFLAIGKVIGKNTIATPQQYRFIDNTPSKGINYYRLKQIDLDGNYSYSNVVSVNFENEATPFQVYPNPAGNMVTLTVPLSMAKSYLYLFDINGKKISERVIDQGTISQTINLSTLPGGIYEFLLVQGKRQQLIKVLKQY